MDGGPFLWGTHADAVVDRADLGVGVQTWAGHHTGYSRLDPALRHDRRVVLDPGERRLTVVDAVTGTTRHSVRLSWHLGPEVTARLTGHVAELRWQGPSGPRRAELELPRELDLVGAPRRDGPATRLVLTPVRRPGADHHARGRGEGDRHPHPDDRPAAPLLHRRPCGRHRPTRGGRSRRPPVTEAVAHVRHISTTMAPPPNAGRQRGSWIRLRGRGRGPTLDSFRPHRRDGS